jgi:hypothetical protein
MMVLKDEIRMQVNSENDEVSGDLIESSSLQTQQLGSLRRTSYKTRQRDDHNRVGLLVVSSLYTFFFVGAFFGWGPLQLLVRPSMRSFMK